jgi:hypothetical protein
MRARSTSARSWAPRWAAAPSAHGDRGAEAAASPRRAAAPSSRCGAAPKAPAARPGAARVCAAEAGAERVRGRRARARRPWAPSRGSSRLSCAEALAVQARAPSSAGAGPKGWRGRGDGWEPSVCETAEPRSARAVRAPTSTALPYTTPPRSIAIGRGIATEPSLRGEPAIAPSPVGVGMCERGGPGRLASEARRGHGDRRGRGVEERLELGDRAQATGPASIAGEHVVAGHGAVCDGRLQLTQRGELELATVDGAHHPALRRPSAFGATDAELVPAARTFDGCTPLRHERVVELVLGVAALARDVHRRTESADPALREQAHRPTFRALTTSTPLPPRRISVGPGCPPTASYAPPLTGVLAIAVRIAQGTRRAGSL